MQSKLNSLLAVHELWFVVQRAPTILLEWQRLLFKMWLCIRRHLSNELYISSTCWHTWWNVEYLVCVVSGQHRRRSHKKYLQITFILEGMIWNDAGISYSAACGYYMKCQLFVCVLSMGWAVLEICWITGMLGAVVCSLVHNTGREIILHSYDKLNLALTRIKKCAFIQDNVYATRVSFMDQSGWYMDHKLQNSKAHVCL